MYDDSSGNVSQVLINYEKCSYFTESLQKVVFDSMTLFYFSFHFKRFGKAVYVSTTFLRDRSATLKRLALTSQNYRLSTNFHHRIFRELSDMNSSHSYLSKRPPLTCGAFLHFSMIQTSKQ